ncbi:MAG: sel1 repeat family protein [Opitutaceae bacterium]|nr:sel1 repeat family protein [Opitutaceae bacterium]
MKPNPFHRHQPRPCARLLLLAALSPLALALGAAPKKDQPAKKTPAAATSTAAKDAADSAPKLISTTAGDDRRWPSLDALKKAADAGDPEACFELGQMHLAGADQVEKNVIRGLLQLETAADRGHAGAAFRLGKIYADGELTPHNPEASLKYYRLAAAAGVSEARHNLGAAYATGRGVKRDYAEGLAWLILAAKTNPEAVASEQRLREFLAKGKRPDLIAAGEKRAVELAKQLAEEAEKKKRAAAVPAPKPAPTVPTVITPPKLEIPPVAPPPKAWP